MSDCTRQDIANSTAEDFLQRGLKYLRCMLHYSDLLKGNRKFSKNLTKMFLILQWRAHNHMSSHCVGLYKTRHRKQHSWIFSPGSFHEHKHLTEWRQHEIPFKPIKVSRHINLSLEETLSWACRKWETSADKPSQLIYKCRSKRDRPIKLAPDKVMIAGKTSWTGDGKTCSWTTLGKIETVIYWKRAPTECRRMNGWVVYVGWFHI